MQHCLPRNKHCTVGEIASCVLGVGGANQWGRVGEQGESQRGKGRKEDETGRGGGIILVHIQSHSLETSVGAVR